MWYPFAHFTKSENAFKTKSAQHLALILRQFLHLTILQLLLKEALNQRVTKRFLPLPGMLQRSHYQMQVFSTNLVQGGGLSPAKKLPSFDVYRNCTTLSKWKMYKLRETATKIEC